MTAAKGKEMYHCDTCGWFVHEPTKPRSICPKCGMPLVYRKCTRCDHEWVPRIRGAVPRNCPACKSPYWNRGRVPRKKDCE